MRFGLFGTGYWAAEVHAAALAAHPDAELVGVWGRDPGKAAALADRYGAAPYDDVDRLLGDVDAIDVALPPDVQAGIATRAARAGKHLLLDKPLALTSRQAHEVRDAAASTGVASVVFFTSRFQDDVAAWLADAATQEWHGAQATWLGSIFHPGNPFGQSPWRRELGGLWDLGPHALSVTLPLMGPVQQVVSAVRDTDDTATVVLRHQPGSTSVLRVGLSVPESAQASRFSAYGESGWTAMPESERDAVACLRTATDQLLQAAGSEQPRHPCDVVFAAEVVDVLEQAQGLLDA